MLVKLIIKNYALIEDVEINFKQGLTVITGETGAGKSILLGALSLILGNRADRSMFKDQTKKCIIEGHFKLNGYRLDQFFKIHELDFEEETILRREINSQGKSRSFINDTPATLEIVKQLGESLIDIHSQNQSNLINESKFQYDFIDSVSGSEHLFKDYQHKFKTFKASKKNLEDLTLKIQQEVQEKDYLDFQFKELESMQLKAGEEQELEEEHGLLANGEEIITATNQINSLLSEGDFNVLDHLNQISASLNKLSSLNAILSSLSLRINSSLIELGDIHQEISDFSNSFEFDPNRLQFIDERLNLIHRLKQKHLVSNADDLLSIQVELDNRLSNINSFDEKLLELKEILKQAESNLIESSNLLSKSRKKAISIIEEKVSKEVRYIEIPNAVFKIMHQIENNFSPYGVDQFEFLFSANKGIAPSVVSKTASGGEVSRLMLCLKNYLAEHKNLPTILFDEIDTGVSGEVANKMGEILSSLGNQRQVISITHLPQIASKGLNHLYVYKEDGVEKTTSKIKEISGQEKIEEIAKMLSGKNITKASINNALELINNN